MKKVSKPQHERETELEASRESFEELSTLFAIANFALESESQENIHTDEDEVDLDIGRFDLCTMYIH